MNKTLLYLITAKGLGDIVVRLEAIRSLIPHYRNIKIVGPEFISNFFDQNKYSCFVEVIPLKKFEKNSSKYLESVHTVIYSSRDHSILGIVKYSFLLIKTKSFLVKNFSLPNIFYLFGLFKKFTENISKTQNEFYLHQSLETLNKDFKFKPFVYSTHPNSFDLIKKIDSFYKNLKPTEFKVSNNQKNIKKVIIFPGGKYQFQRWPFYKELIVKLLSTNEYQLTIMAAKSSELDAFLEFESNQNIFLKHSLDLINVMNDINESDLVIANDSGPKHLCTQCNTNFLAIEGCMSDWSVVTYDKNCFTIFFGGFGLHKELNKKIKSKILTLIDSDFVYSSIKILTNHDNSDNYF